VLELGEQGATHDGRQRQGDGIDRGDTDALRRVPIRYKLVVAMILPLLSFVVVLGLEVRKIDRQTDAVQRQTQLATSADGPTGLLTALQDERSWAAVDVIGQGGQFTLAVEGYDLTRHNVDEAVAGFRDFLAHSGEETRQAYAAPMEGIEDRLAEIRERIDSSPLPHMIGDDQVEFGNATFALYGEVLNPFLDGIAQIALAIDQPDLRQGAELIEGASRQIEVTANLPRSLIITGLLTSGGIDTREERADVSSWVWRMQRLARNLQAETTGLYAPADNDRMFVDFTQTLTDQSNMAMHGAFDLDTTLAALNVPMEDQYNGYRNVVAEILRDEAKRLQDAATRREQIYLFLIGLTVVIALVIMLAVSWSITRPMHSLTRQAMDMAHHRLGHAIARILRTPLGQDVAVPEMEPITVATSDEVADVATVLNTVQDSALELAAGQAVLRRNLADSFVNLGRRNQNLLSRQLDFITMLEQNEADPITLGHLFQLDHLATRMRRNAESLLVLAGNESPRKWTAPVRIQDIIRAAVSEVEDYQRVILRVVEPVTIVGTAAADLAHLLAELIENALLFSPSDETVEIRGLTQPAGYTLAIIDQGLGMTPDEIARANRRLAGAESFTVAPSKYLGHYVAGNLAVRHGIYVRLQHSPGAGITATVHLPAALATGGGSAVAMLAPGTAALGAGAPALGRGTPALGATGA
jgi:signal transduction histidine kinase